SRQLALHNQALHAALTRADDNWRTRARHLYVAHMNLAQRAWLEGRIGHVLELLDRYEHPDSDHEDLRGFEWHYLKRQCHRERLRLRGHRSWVTSVAVSSDGKHIASASGDGTVKLWDAVTGQEIRTLRGHAGEVTNVTFSPDGRLLASAGADGTVRLWRIDDGTLTGILR